jgi:hypothetical protein
MSWPKALLWGAAIVAALFAVLFGGYFAVQYFLALPHS